MLKDHYCFIATFHYAKDGISISFQDLQGCFSCAKTTIEAIKNSQEALSLHLWRMEQNNDEIPEPTLIETIHLEDGRVAVAIEVYMPLIRENEMKMDRNVILIKKTVGILEEKGNYVLEDIKIDGIEPSKEFLELAKKLDLGEISNEEICKQLNQKCKMKEE